MISQRRGEKGTKARPCLPHTASPGAPACPAPAPAPTPAPSPPRSHGRPPPRTKVPRGTSASGGENQFPFCNKPAGEGEADGGKAGRRSGSRVQSHGHPSCPHGAELCSWRWERAEGAAPGGDAGWQGSEGQPPAPSEGRGPGAR